MASLVNLVMEAAATEVLYEERDQIEQEMGRLLAEVEHSNIRGPHYGVFCERFMELLKRRGEVARKALILSILDRIN
jgi:hypothetical protein